MANSATEPLVLVVDDGAVDRRMAGAIIEQRLHWRVAYAGNGSEALDLVAKQPPQMILTDLCMPEMDGLELVEKIRARHPLIPVVLMTAFGSEDIAHQALRKGAASYVPKRSLDGELVSTLEQVLIAAQVETHQQRLLDQLERAELHFTFENDYELIPALVRHLQEYLGRLQLCDQTGRIRICVALEEAMLNAMHHGNLELSSDLREQGNGMYFELGEQRRRQSPYQERRVHCDIKLSRSEVVFTIRDDGPGFDPSTLPDPTDPSNLERVFGRGVLLMRTFMDEVQYNDKGNQVTMIKRREAKE